MAATGPVCVTGGSGFLASWIVKMLLDKGYTVHTTTRRIGKALFLTEMLGRERLTIFDGCDFSDPCSFDKAIEGCDAVIHCASPFFNAGATRQNLVDPAVAGTEVVLNACNKFNVKKVTLTASSACVIVDYGSKAAQSHNGNHIYTEKDFSPQDILEQNNNWYSLSKLLAELKAWEISKNPCCTFKLCVLNPSLIWGPMIPQQPHLNTSLQAIIEYMDGSHKFIQNGYRCVVDVRDVAEAHIVPIEKDIGWGQRFLLFGGTPHFQEIAGYVKNALLASDHPRAREMAENVPTQVDQICMPTIMGPPSDKPLLYDCTPAEQILGIKFRSVKEMVSTSVHELLANGYTGSSQYDPNKL
jgi:dihydroflavonol-4-reductase